MPEPSLLETLRQEHPYDHNDTGGPDMCAGCLVRWPCPVARYIERSEALAKAGEKLPFPTTDEGCAYCGGGTEAHNEACPYAAFVAALAAYREGP